MEAFECLLHRIMLNASNPSLSHCGAIKECWRCLAINKNTEGKYAYQWQQHAPASDRPSGKKAAASVYDKLKIYPPLSTIIQVRICEVLYITVPHWQGLVAQLKASNTEARRAVVLAYAVPIVLYTKSALIRKWSHRRIGYLKPHREFWQKTERANNGPSQLVAACKLWLTEPTVRRSYSTAREYNYTKTFPLTALLYSYASRPSMCSARKEKVSFSKVYSRKQGLSSSEVSGHLPAKSLKQSHYQAKSNKNTAKSHN